MEGDEWGYRGYTRVRGSREAVTGAKSTCSGGGRRVLMVVVVVVIVVVVMVIMVDDHDSVHSLPVGSQWTESRSRAAIVH